MKKLPIIFALVLMISFCSAHYADYKETFFESKYFPEERYVWSQTHYVNYDNDERYSTYAYANGYSYRTTREYWEDHYTEEVITTKRVVYDDYSDDRYKISRYEYVPHMRGYEERDCYVIPPRDKLFYIKC